QILELQAFLQKQAKQGDYNILKGLTAIAIALKLHHAIELLETQSIKAFYLYLQDLYEQAKNKKSKAVLQIIKNKDFQRIFLRTIELYNKGKEHPKLEKLKEIIEQEIKANNQ
ncbi:hypothetical protein, partial [Escherichia coli]|uniref:hypothetical protein n=1 Tax=Escherichia coli TaxID=562 RepID=UPI00195FC8C4